MSAYLIELASLMAVFSFVIVSPGVDTAMIMRQSLVYGRRAGIASSFGLGASLLFHVGYTILGLGLIISQSLLLFSLLKWAGAAYLIYMGVMAFRAPEMSLPQAQTNSATIRISPIKAFSIGFATSALNPKPVLFFLSLFSVLVSHETPPAIQFCYGLLMASALVAWFAAVSCFLTIPAIREKFTRAGRWFNRVSGIVFVGLGLRLAAFQAE